VYFLHIITNYKTSTKTPTKTRQKPQQKTPTKTRQKPQQKLAKNLPKSIGTQ